MSTPGAPAAPRAVGVSSTIPRWSWVALGIILLMTVWLRAHTFGPAVREAVGFSLWPVSGAEGEPLDCDEAIYAYIGHRIDRGDVMYRDLTENKPPLGYWIYAAAVALAGYNELAIRAMPIPMVLLTIALLWWIALRLGGPAAACLAAGLYGLTSTDPYVYGNGANLEHPMNLFAVASLAAMVRAWRPDAGRWWLALAGAAAAAASLVKQVAITHLLVYGGALILVSRPAKAQVPAIGRGLLALAAGFCVAWLLAVGVLVAQRAGQAASDDIVRFGSAMVTQSLADPHAPAPWKRWLTGNADPRTGALPWPFGATDYLVWWGTGTWPLWLASLAGLVWLWRGRTSPSRRLVAAWTLSAWVEVILPGQYWQHYYLLPLPGVALAVGLLAADLGGLARASGGGRRLVAGAGVLILSLAVLATVGIQVRDYLLVPPQELTVRYKGGQQWVSLRTLGRELGRRTRAWHDPHLYVWGWQSPLYVYSRLDSVSPLCFANDVVKAQAGRADSVFRPRIERLLNDLAARQPEFVFAGDPPFPELLGLLTSRYRPAPIAIGQQRLLVTADGRGLWVRRDVAEPFLSGASASPNRDVR